MKRLILIMIAALLSLYSFAQDEVKVSILYDKQTQDLIVELENTSDELTFVVRGQDPILDELNGSTLCVSEFEKKGFIPYIEMFPLIEYDRKLKKSKMNSPFLITLPPHQKESYAIKISEQEKLKTLKCVFVAVDLIVRRVLKDNKIIDDKTFHRTYKKYVKIE